MRPLTLLVLTLTLLSASACSTMRGKRIEARYARRMARSPQSMTMLRDTVDAQSSAGAALAAPPPAPRVVLPAPPPAAPLAPFAPSPSPLLKRSAALGSDQYCGGQPCRDLGTSREWHRSL